MEIRRDRWPILNALGFALMIAFNGLAAGLPLNGMETGELSDLYPNLFVPAGVTFSIWGLIYVWLLAFTICGFVRARTSRALEAIGPWFVISCAANAAWIVAWHWMAVGLSLALMLLILTSLIVIYRRLEIGVGTPSAGDRWLVHAPFSIYLGWITVATIANVTALAVTLGAPSFGSVPAGLTVGVMSTAVFITASVLWTRRDTAYALVVMWAFLGIHLKRASASDDGSGLVANGAFVGLVVIGLIIAGSARRRVKDTRLAAPR